MTKPDFGKINEEVSDELRSLGIYAYADTSDFRWIDPNMGQEEEDDGETLEKSDDERREGAKENSYILMVTGQLGEVAFSSRVQNPEQADVDAEFRAMAFELKRQQFEDSQGSIADDLDKLMGQ